MLHFFARRMKEAREDERGFTLIELLVVVIIIGILAAIAIPVFLSQREGANTAACRSDVRNGSASATAFAADNNGSYVGMTPTILQAPGDGTTPGYDWNLSAQSSAPAVTGPGGTGTPTATGYRLSVTCTGGSAATYTFDSATGRVSP